jgi:hypothetical protein
LHRAPSAERDPGREEDPEVGAELEGHQVVRTRLVDQPPEHDDRRERPERSDEGAPRDRER